MASALVAAEVDLEAAVAGEGHLEQRRDQAAVASGRGRR